jgi:hypothetical protein
MVAGLIVAVLLYLRLQYLSIFYGLMLLLLTLIYSMQKIMIDFKFTCLYSPTVPSHREVTVECASTEYGCAFLYKAQAMNVPCDDVPRSASNEESVTGTTSKDDAENSKTSSSNVEDARSSFSER